MKARPKKSFKQREAPRPKLPRPMREPGGIGGGQRIQNPSPPPPPPPPDAPPPPPTPRGQIAHWYHDLVGETGSEVHPEDVLPGALALVGGKTRGVVLHI